jgi:hypothetical protein
LSGILEGLDRNGWSDVAVIGCGAYGANAFAASMAAGALTADSRGDEHYHLHRRGNFDAARDGSEQDAPARSVF